MAHATQLLRPARDILWLAALVVAAAAGFAAWGAALDGYETALLVLSVPALAALGVAWRNVQWFCAAAAALSLCALALYRNDIARGEEIFLLRYFLASQPAVMWMGVLFVLSTVFYFCGWLGGRDFALSGGAGLAWGAALMGLCALLVRWRESYLVNPDYGHIPVSNLYEVFVLFCIVTTLIHLHFEERTRARAVGGFVMLLVSAAVAFLLWYTLDRQAHLIQPLVPALQSWWMKIHVPANFIGYGAFAVAAMVAAAGLLRRRLAGAAISRLPSTEVLDALVYRATVLGFAFFTVATILGALWAADAWGSYWSWDPKETWALIVWLNYAAWLHFRMARGSGGVMLWWSILGLGITAFAFLGVNLFLSGLHSYGEL